MSDTPRTDALGKDERHNNVEETAYWCNRYKGLARQLEIELARRNARFVRVIDAARVVVDCPAPEEIDALRAILDEQEKS